MPTTITPNPFDNYAVKNEIAKLDLGIYTELHQWKNKTPTSAQLRESTSNLEHVIRSSLFIIGEQSLFEGCKEVDCVVPASLQLELRQSVRHRAAYSAQSIIDTTAISFGLPIIWAALKKKNAVGKKRSKSVAEYEGPRVFFEQRTKAWRLKAGVMKAWYATTDNVCADCEDNEDEGKIPIDEEFPSGDLFPPGHIHCGCLVSLIL